MYETVSQKKSEKLKYFTMFKLSKTINRGQKQVCICTDCEENRAGFQLAK